MIKIKLRRILNNMLEENNTRIDIQDDNKGIMSKIGDHINNHWGKYALGLGTLGAAAAAYEYSPEISNAIDNYNKEKETAEHVEHNQKALSDYYNKDPQGKEYITNLNAAKANVDPEIFKNYTEYTKAVKEFGENDPRTLELLQRQKMLMGDDSNDLTKYIVTQNDKTDEHRMLEQNLKLALDNHKNVSSVYGNLPWQHDPEYYQNNFSKLISNK